LPGTPADPRPLRWTREQFYRLAEVGLLPERRVERIDGEILAMSPQGPPHFHRICRIHDVLARCGWAGVVVRIQGPLCLGEDSDPEPDIAVVAGSVDDYARAHPTGALLVVEVSDTTLAHDRTRKAALYARHGVGDYWVANLAEGVLEVRRGPAPDVASPWGWSYSETRVLRPGDSIAPLAAPSVQLAVAELMG
jgi:Uma2 family endonuclease